MDRFERFERRRGRGPERDSPRERWPSEGFELFGRRGLDADRDSYQRLLSAKLRHRERMLKEPRVLYVWAMRTELIKPSVKFAADVLVSPVEAIPHKVIELLSRPGKPDALVSRQINLAYAVGGMRTTLREAVAAAPRAVFGRAQTSGRRRSVVSGHHLARGTPEAAVPKTTRLAITSIARHR